MARDHDYYVYLLTNQARTVLYYIGITSELEGRMREHLTRAHPGSFTDRYEVDQLVYYEEFGGVEQAIAREKQLKGWTRAKKNALLAKWNPCWAA